MKKFFVAFCLLFLTIPIIGFAQEDVQIEVPETLRFEARVIEVTQERELEREDGSTYTQQNLQLIGLEDRWEDREFEFFGISSYEVFGQAIYKEGQRVVVTVSTDIEGNEIFFVIDHVRRAPIYLLIALFVSIIIAVGAWKGLRSLIGLVASFAIIMGAIIPAILAGWNPVLVSIVGAFLILVVIVYITEGLNRKSHLAILSVFVALLLTGALSILFTYITHLTGTSQEEAMYLVGLGKTNIDFQGLLLAAILIGTVGILDDVVISQISSVNEIKKANPNLENKDVFSRAFNIGKSHLGSMVNTLFLAYAGAALPLLILFSLNQPPFDTLSSVMNNELIATEIVRTIVGSIGIALAMPIATYFAVKYIKIKAKDQG